MQRKRHVNLKVFYILGILFTVALGSLLHYVFEWSNENHIIAFFSPTNESTWEHIKMLAYPMLIFSILEYIKIGPAYDNYIIAKALGILSGMIAITMLFYTYTGVIGKNNLVMDIIVFVLSVMIAYTISCYLLKHRIFRSSIFQPVGVLLVLAIIIAFMWFTFFPPKIALFLDPATQAYGLPK